MKLILIAFMGFWLIVELTILSHKIIIKEQGRMIEQISIQAEELDIQLRDCQYNLSLK